jgi:hypothetical protein
VDELGFDSLELILNSSFSDKKSFVDVKYGWTRVFTFCRWNM